MKRKRIVIYVAVIILALLIMLIGYRRYTYQRLDYVKLKTVCFEKDVLPVFLKNCGVAGCHDMRSASGNYKFVDYNSIIKSVVPFNPEKSIVYKSIIGEGASKMPPGQELTENETLLINVWIGQGAGNTVCSLSALK